MGSKIMLILFFLITTFYGNNGGSDKILEVERKIYHLRKHSLKTIQSENEIIDCIDIGKQPAFEHPKLKDHKIRMGPSHDSVKEDITKETNSTTKSGKMMKQNLKETFQLWQKSGRCPNGTIPIRRIKKRELLKARSFNEYGRKKQSFFFGLSQLNENNSSVSLANHSKAVFFTDGQRYVGAKGDIEVCRPFVENQDEYSTSQISLINSHDSEYEFVEAGWAVNPSLYGDNETRFFTYWTADDSNTTGCFDLTCSGFVQISDKIALGSTINPILISSETPLRISIHIYKDLDTNNWWLRYGDTDIGYWPSELFNVMRYHADLVEWGGEVYSKNVGDTPHTKTEMGNGQYPTANEIVPGNSSVIVKMRVQVDSLTLNTPELVNEYTDEFNCYGVRYTQNVEDPEFYYGGPGRNPDCL